MGADERGCLGKGIALGLFSHKNNCVRSKMQLHLGAAAPDALRISGFWEIRSSQGPDNPFTLQTNQTIRKEWTETCNKVLPTPQRFNKAGKELNKISKEKSCIKYQFNHSLHI